MHSIAHLYYFYAPLLCKPTSVRWLDDLHFWLIKDMLDLFQRFCSFRSIVKVLRESARRGIDMHNSSHAIGSLHASQLQEVTVTVDKYCMCSMSSLNTSLFPRKGGSTIQPILTICQPEDFCLWYTWQVLNICSQLQLSLKAPCPICIRQECHLPPNNRKLTIPPLSWYQCTHLPWH